MKILCITDPATHPEFDTTVELYRRLASRPDVILYHTAPELIDENGGVNAAAVGEPPTYEAFLGLSRRAMGESGSPIGDFDLVFCRTDKPYPAGYLEKLARFERTTRFVNRPSGLAALTDRAFLPSRWPHLLADSLVTSDPAEAESFCRRHGMTVVKRNHSYGGRGVFRIEHSGSGWMVSSSGDVAARSHSSFQALMAEVAAPGERLLFVRFVGDIARGDKRVLVVDGEIYGGYIRRSTTGSWVHNITAGGASHVATVTDWERDAIRETCGAFHSQGAFTLGYDFLCDGGDRWLLSEVNAGNVGGYNRLEELTGEPVMERLIDWLRNFAKRH